MTFDSITTGTTLYDKETNCVVRPTVSPRSGSKSVSAYAIIGDKLNPRIERKNFENRYTHVSDAPQEIKIEYLAEKLFQLEEFVHSRLN